MVLYAWLWEMMELPKKDFKLFNIKSGELFKLVYNIDQLTQIVVLILKGKYQKPVFKSDQEFLDSSIEYINISSSNFLMIEAEKFITL